MTQFKVTFPGNKKVDVEFDNFTIKTDQKKLYGGDDTAPEPFNIFLSSLASCAGIYAISFCEIRKLDTNGMHLILEVVFNEGQKYIKAVIKSMDGCAVKNQLNPEIKTNTSVVYPD